MEEACNHVWNLCGCLESFQWHWSSYFGPLYSISKQQSRYRPGGASEVSRKLRFPDFVTRAQDGVKVVTLRHRPPLLTYSMVQSSSWEPNWFAASQEIPRISRNPNLHYRTHKRPTPLSILGQPNPVHIPAFHLVEIHPNIIHPSTPRSPQWSPSLRFPHQDPIHPLSSPIRAICPAVFTRRKNPLTSAGIEPATFGFVAQHLNRCATAVPSRQYKWNLDYSDTYYSYFLLTWPKRKNKKKYQFM